MRNIKDVILKDGKNLKEVLELHEKWVNCEVGGVRADLTGADLTDSNLTDADLTGADLRGADLTDANLRGADLRGADLRGADLRGADLTDANLRGADLRGANLTDADLRGADLAGADLTGADLTDADLRGANLRGANLKGADLKDIIYNEGTSFFALQCPEEGSFIGYKKANNKIVKLLITEDAKRSSATSRKCRCSKAKVLSITSLDEKENYDEVVSNHDKDFKYKVGEIVEVKDFDENRWNECSTGIHFFITRQEAVNYRC